MVLPVPKPDEFHTDALPRPLVDPLRGDSGGGLLLPYRLATVQWLPGVVPALSVEDPLWDIAHLGLHPRQDVYLDLNRNGAVDAGEPLLVNDTFLIANHSHKAHSAQGVPAVLPNVLNGHDPGGEGRGVGDAGG